jgi:hypothetical protein
MRRQSFLEAEIFGKPEFRLVDDLFQAGKAGKRQAVDRERTNLADRCVGLESRPAAFLVYERQHRVKAPHDLINTFVRNPLS